MEVGSIRLTRHGSLCQHILTLTNKKPTTPLDLKCVFPNSIMFGSSLIFLTQTFNYKRGNVLPQFDVLLGACFQSVTLFNDEC